MFIWSAEALSFICTHKTDICLFLKKIMYKLATPYGHVHGNIPNASIDYEIQNGIVRLSSEEEPGFCVETNAKRLLKCNNQNGIICIVVNTVCSNDEGDATGYTSSRVTMIQENVFHEVAGLVINNDVMVVDDASALNLWIPLLKYIGAELRNNPGVHKEIPGPYSKLLILNLKHPAFGH